MAYDKISPIERRIAISLSGVFASRMLGLFMIFPVFMLYAEAEFNGYTATLAGLAMGIYGLTQALFQIPLGMLSDRIGRKPVIIGGLVVFAVGSVIAAMATDLSGVILGRAMQGAGAIASAVMALAADLSREEQRTKMMAFIGISIGLSFALAMVLGPLFHGWFGVRGIFWITAGLALCGMIIISGVPRPVIRRFHRDTELEPSWFRHAIRDGQLIRVDLGILTLHLVLMSMMVVVPGLLQTNGLPAEHHWYVYLPVLFSSMLFIVPFIIVAEKKRKIKAVLIGAVTILLVSQLLFPGFSGSMAGLVFVILLFFTAFNLLEAMLPSLVAKLAPATHKGTAMGVYSSSQFLGIFIGGSVGGWLLEHHGMAGVFQFTAAVTGIWLLSVVTMRQPRYLSSQLLHVGSIDETRAEELARELSKIRGVIESTVIAADGVAYLKIDKLHLDSEALMAYSVSQSAA